jgi:SAM-dependent methyltransferase
MKNDGKDPVDHKLTEMMMRDDHAEKFGGCEHDDKRYRTPLFNEIEIFSVLRLLDLRKGDLVADLGCGTGRFTIEIMTRGGRVVPVDFSLVSLERLREGTDGRISPMQADLTKLPIKDGSVDGIISIQVIQHLPDEDEMVKALEEMKRILKPGGSIVITVKRRKGGAERRTMIAEGSQHYFTTFSKEDLRGLAKKAGMNKVSIHTCNIGQRLFDKMSRILKNSGIPKDIWIALNAYMADLPFLEKYCDHLVLKMKK